ncbi:hypothetical protein RAH42_13170 (plasmid) [Pyramidobacter sp. YE332]|uniref:hypothetical protein n=1 Tax=Pyramidobacter sp. YE332 TaxID=3068894 RepID=UPI00294A9BF7|nr:hypothetical protein [Pyramidobacter sp. YE332]WOL39617.1 hypothetical protein RAH42_10800 [Pyramidobacter sp. YE332]WOL41363.1 hypothetical protein RAH42_13170 [Pyramidobacter sp. YE332]
MNNKNLLHNTATAFFMIVYFSLGVVQTVAFYQGLRYWLDWNWFFCLLISIPLSYIPVVGTVLGIVGALKVWQWPWLLTGVVFLFPYIVVLPLAFSISRD